MQGLGIRQPRGEVGHGAHEPAPVAPERREAVAAHDQAQVRHAILDQLQPGIAAREQSELHMTGQRLPLRLGQPQMQLQAERSRRACPPPAAQLVLAGGEQRHGRERAGAIALDPHALACGLERPDLDAAPDRDAPPRRLGQQPARRAGGATGPRRGTAARRPPPCVRPTSRTASIGAAPRPAGGRPSAASSAAASPLRNSPQTLSCGPRVALEQHDAPAGHGQPGGGGRTGEPAAGDRDVPAHPEPTVRKRIASAVRPGPNARAQPGRAGPARASIRASTNMTVAELILP